MGSIWKLNGDNNGNLYIYPDPQNLYNFNIVDRFMDIFEFELVNDMAFCRFVMKVQTTAVCSNV